MAFHIFSSDLPVEVRRAFIIIFIFATVFANLIFILRCRRVSDILTKPVFCSRITSCLGGILLALFSYVIMGRIFFHDTEDISCISIITSTIYFACFLPFVFGTALLLQGLNVLVDQQYDEERTTSSMAPRIKSVLVAVLPWLLGFVMVCPLTMGDTEWDDVCFALPWSRGRARAIEVICIIIPASAALICSIVLVKIGKPSSFQKPENDTILFQQSQAPTAPSVDQGPLMVATQLPYPLHSYTEKYPQQYPEQYPPQYYPQNSEHEQPPRYAELYPQQYPQVNTQQNPYGQTQDYPPVHSQQYLQMYSQQYPQQYPPSPTPNPQSGAPPLYTPTPVNTTSALDDIESRKNMKRTLLLSSIVFAVSVIPASAFTLGYHLSHDPVIDMDSDMETILSELFYWLMFVYPVVIPLIWRKDIKSLN